MSNLEEDFQDYKPSHGPMHTDKSLIVHPWDITYSDYIGIHGETEETYYFFFGTQKDVRKEMQRVFDDNFDGGTDTEGYPPFLPDIIAHCAKCNISIIND